jgi:cell division protein FtsN
MKPATQKYKTARKSRGGTLLGIFIGLVLGVLISFGVVWYMKKMPLPFQDKAAHFDRPAVEENNGQPLPLPGKPGDKVSEKPRFEFYKILPGNEEATPAAAPAGAKAGEAKSAAELYLQVGSFQKAADADNLKAKLALMGVEAAVLEVDIPDKGKMNRVRAGPFASQEEMNRVRAELSQSGVQANPVKGK